jgi:predicted Zn-dependent protease
MRRCAVALVLCLLPACQKVPGTGRLQYNVIPDDYLNPLGKQAFKDAKADEREIASGPDAQTVERVAKNIQAVVEKQVDFNWQVALFDDQKTVNAWCLPGGKIGVYSGLLPVVENEAGLAFVIGHEVAHAVAGHSGERLTQQLTAEGGLLALQLYLSQDGKLDAEKQKLILAAVGLGAEVGVLLPYSRLQESEADRLGLMYMARAGYPPEESIAVWKRMRKNAGDQPPEFLSTHPDYGDRIDNMKEHLAVAEKRYQRNKGDTAGRSVTSTLWNDAPSTAEVDEE